MGLKASKVEFSMSQRLSISLNTHDEQRISSYHADLKAACKFISHVNEKVGPRTTRMILYYGGKYIYIHVICMYTHIPPGRTFAKLLLGVWLRCDLFRTFRIVLGFAEGWFRFSFRVCLGFI